MQQPPLRRRRQPSRSLQPCTQALATAGANNPSPGDMQPLPQPSSLQQKTQALQPRSFWQACSTEVDTDRMTGLHVPPQLLRCLQLAPAKRLQRGCSHCRPAVAPTVACTWEAGTCLTALHRCGDCRWPVGPPCSPGDTLNACVSAADTVSCPGSTAIHAHASSAHSRVPLAAELLHLQPGRYPLLSSTAGRQPPAGYRQLAVPPPHHPTHRRSSSS